MKNLFVFIVVTILSSCQDLTMHEHHTINLNGLDISHILTNYESNGSSRLGSFFYNCEFKYQNRIVNYTFMSLERYLDGTEKVYEPMLVRDLTLAMQYNGQYYSNDKLKCTFNLSINAENLMNGYINILSTDSLIDYRHQFENVEIKRY